jgi:hypothetical protein
MKVSLTLNDFPVERLSALAAFLAGSTAPTAVAHAAFTPPTTAPATPAAAGDDDETGDSAAAPGTVDKNGLPWDARIHSDPPKLTKKNEWRARRGVDNATVATVEAELRARFGGTPGGAMPAPPAPQQPAPAIFPPNAGYPAIPGNVVHNPPAPAAPQPQYQPQPEPAAQPQYQPAPQPAPAPAAPTQLDFQSFMTKLQGLLAMRDAAGQAIVTADYLANVTQRTAAAFNVPAQSMMDFQTRPDILQYVVQLMASEGKWF